MVGFGMAIDGNDQVLAVRRPGSAIGAKFVAAVGEIAVGDLARCAAIAIDYENLHVAGLEIAHSIETIDQTIIGSRRIGPFRAGRRSWEVGDVRTFSWNER